MTKEELLKKIDICGIDNIAITGIKHSIKQFFESNVVIPKGANHHPNSDALHIAIESNGEIELEICFENRTDFQPYSYRNNPKDIIRIKPHEPIYEWQWITNTGNNFYCISDKHLTEYEANTTNSIKIEESKRERK